MLVIKLLLILYSTALVLAAQSGTKAVASGAIFVGEDATRPGATPLEIFGVITNHATAASSILVNLANLANFHPATQPAKSLVSTLTAFTYAASIFPGFVPGRNEKASLALNGSFSQFEQVIREYNLGYSHQALVARNLRDLIPGYIVDKDADGWVLNLVVIDRDGVSNAVMVGIVSVTLSIDSDSTGSAYIPKQDAIMATSFFKVNQGFLTEYAATLSVSIPITKVRDYLDFFTSPKMETDVYRTIAATPFHKKSDAFVNQGQHALYDWQNGVV